MAILEPAMLLGLGAVALWVDVRFPRLRPQSLMRAVGHVAASFFFFSLIANGVDFWLRLLPARLAAGMFIIGILIPTLWYILMSWIWLIVRLHDLSDSKPRGGHRVSTAKT